MLFEASKPKSDSFLRKARRLSFSLCSAGIDFSATDNDRNRSGATDILFPDYNTEGKLLPSLSHSLSVGYNIGQKMIETPKIINVGKSYLVYKGDEYKLKGERVLKHTRERTPARRNKDLGQIIAVYSEILHNDSTVDYHRQMMDKAEIDQFLAKAKRRGRKMSAASLRQAAKAEAILKTEFHSLDATEPAANPLLGTRPLRISKFFLVLSPITLYAHFAFLWILLGRDVSSWPISADNLLPLWIGSFSLYIVAVLYAFYWLFAVSWEVTASRETQISLPHIWYYILAILIPAGGYLANQSFIAEDDTVTISPTYALAIIIGAASWLVFTVRFFQRLGRLIGQTLPQSLIPALPFILMLPLAPISIIYFQKRLNILDKNKMNFLI